MGLLTWRICSAAPAIQEWADEAETGYYVEKLRKRVRPALGAGPGAGVPVRDAPSMEALNTRGEGICLPIRGDPRSGARLDSGLVKAHKSTLKHGITKTPVSTQD
ncbi:hypothetical protein BDB13_0466 [Rhodococcus sp. OK302]|nr:hypothetical protein BDB13_0466 [Rhodococcus sp. OK302]